MVFEGLLTDSSVGSTERVREAGEAHTPESLSPGVNRAIHLCRERLKVSRHRHGRVGHLTRRSIETTPILSLPSPTADFWSSPPYLAPCLLFLRFMKTTSEDQVAAQKNPDEWKTGDEPMTAAQRSYLETLAQDAGESFDEELTKAEASKRIEELRGRSPRIAGE